MADTKDSTHRIQVGEEFPVTAVRLNDDGEGVAAIQGLTVFVPQLLVQESATIRIVSVHRRFARGQIVQRISNAPHRIIAKCSVYGACGGCQLQHLDYANQLLHKQAIVAWALRKLPQQDQPHILPVLGMNDPFRYRNQVQVPIQWHPNKGIRIGFFGAESHHIVETTSCHLEPLAMEETVRQVAAWIADQVPAFAQKVHHIIVRQSFTTEDIMVILAMTNADYDDVNLQNLLDLPGVVSMGLTIQPRVNGPVWGKQVHILAGRTHLVERLLGLEFLISPRSFFQVNTRQAEKLYAKVLQYAHLQGNETVLDAYSGTGTMALLLARRAKFVMGIESIEPAVEDARNNAQHNDIHNVDFMVGEVETIGPKLQQMGRSFDVIVMDPPRKGAHPNVLQTILQVKPKRIIYVSCNPATLGRDVEILVAGGYEVKEVQPVDLFPQTSHVESCALLVRKV